MRMAVVGDLRISEATEPKRPQDLIGPQLHQSSLPSMRRTGGNLRKAAELKVRVEASPFNSASKCQRRARPDTASPSPKDGPTALARGRLKAGARGLASHIRATLFYFKSRQSRGFQHLSSRRCDTGLASPVHKRLKED